MGDFTFIFIDLINPVIIVLFIVIFVLADIKRQRDKQRKAIKVLKKGDRAISWYQITCPYCNSVLEFSSEHIQMNDKSVSSHTHLQDREYITCPVCEKEFGVHYKTEIRKEQIEL